MKNLKDCILSLFIGTWLGGLLPACTHDDEIRLPDRNDGFHISIALSVGEAPIARAYDGALSDLPGEGAEDYIDIEDLRIYAFSSNGGQPCLAQVYPDPNVEGLMKPEVTPVGGKYYLKAELPYDIFSQNQQFKLVAVANNGKSVVEKGSTLLGDFVKNSYTISYTANSPWFPQWGTSGTFGLGIPMFGVQKVNLSGYDFKTHNEFNPYLLKNVNMLRAMAKIEVDVEEGKGFNITSVSLLAGSYYDGGCIAPVGAASMTETEDVKLCNIPEPNPVTVSSPLPFYRDGATGKFVAYVPEFDLGNENSRKDKIELTIDDETYHLSLTKYAADGKPSFTDSDAYPWNALLRNHVYRYTITEVQGLAIQIKCVILPWSVEKLEPNFE